jgi:aminomethyltransferase
LGIASANKFDVQLGEPDVSPLSLQGPKATDLMEKISGNWVRDLKFFYFKETTINNIRVVIARSGWSGEVGYEIYLMDGEKGNKLWEIIMKAGQEFKIAPAAPSQISRIESGMLSYGNDMTLDENPFDLGMDKFVNLQKKADFLSKKALTDIHKNGPTKELIGIEIPGNFQDEFSSDYVPIYSDSDKVGRITSSVYSPRLKKNIALGIINKRSGSVNGSYFIKKNNSDFEINVCDLPFLRNK